MQPNDFVIVFDEIDLAISDDDAHYLGDRMMYRALISIGQEAMAEAWWRTTKWAAFDSVAKNEVPKKRK